MKDCRMQLILKSQFEAMSRYEHVNEKKLLEQMLDNVLLGRAKGRSETVRNFFVAVFYIQTLGIQNM